MTLENLILTLGN